MQRKVRDLALFNLAIDRKALGTSLTCHGRADRRFSRAYPLFDGIKSGYALALCSIVRLIGKPLHAFPDAL